MRDKILCKESTHDRVRQPPEVMLPLGGIHKKEDGARTGDKEYETRATKKNNKPIPIRRSPHAHFHERHRL